MTDIPLSSLPVQSPSDTGSLYLVGYDLTKAPGYQNTTINLSAALAAGVANAGNSTNTPSTLVLRDASGNFSAGTITANLFGNATTANQLAASVAINLTGDATGTVSTTFNGPVSVPVTLASVGTAGTYNNVSIDAKGRVVSGNNNVAFAGQTGSLANVQSATVLGRTWHVDNYGAAGNAQQIVAKFSMVAGSAALTSTTSIFTSGMTGMTFIVPAAGPYVTYPANGTFAGGSFPSALVATATYISPTALTLSVAASTTVSGIIPLTYGTDDSGIFNTALTALGSTGGGTLNIHTQKRYLIANQISVPQNTGINGGTKPVTNNGVWNYQGATLIVAPGVPMSGAHSGNFYNPEHSTCAISLSGQGAWIENCYVMAANLWNIQTALDQEAMIFGTMYGMPVNGNGIQLDARSNIVKNVCVLGFSRGIVNVPTLITSGGAYVGSSGGFPVIDNVLADNSMNFEFGPNGTTVNVDKPTCNPYISGGLIGVSGSYLTFAAPVSDGAGGCVISLTSGTTTINGAAPVWTSGTNAYIGSPASNGTSTLTVTLFDVNSIPVTNTGMTANRVTGNLVVNGSGFDLHLAGVPPTTFTNYGAVSNGGVVSIGSTGVAAVPEQAGFSAVSCRYGPGMYLNQSGFIHIRSPHLITNGILCNNASQVHITEIDCDGQADAATATFGFAVALMNGCSSITVKGGAVNNFFGNVYNNSIVTPRGGDAFEIDGVSSDGPNVAIFQNGSALTWRGGFLGHAGAIAHGPNSQGFTITATTWATPLNNSNTPVTVLQSTAAPAIYVDANCIGAPTNLLPAAANFSVGTVAAINAGSQPTVVLTQTGPSVSLSFGIPAGQTGATGLTGATGPQGPQAIVGTPTGTWNALTNTPTLSAGGGGGSAGNTLVVSVGGTQSITGGSVTFGVGDIIIDSGSAWLRVPSAGSTGAYTNLTSTNATFTTLNSPLPTVLDTLGNVLAESNANAGQSYMPGAVLEAGSNGRYLNLINSVDRQIAVQIDTQTGNINTPGGNGNFKSITATTGTIGTLTVTTALNAPSSSVVDTLGNVVMATSTSVGELTVPGANVETGSNGIVNIVNAHDRQVLAKFNTSTGAVAFAGTLTAPNIGGGSASTTFTSQDISNHNVTALAYWQSVQNQVNTTSQRPAFTYNLMLEQGESKIHGSQSAVALTTSRPARSNALMIGQATKPATLTTYSGVGSNAFYPMAAQNFASGGLATARTGALTGLTNVSVVVSGGNATITYTGAAPATVFQVGDTCEFSGFTVATGNNYSLTGLTYATVVSMTAGSPNTMVVTPNNNAWMVNATNENGIEIAQVDYPNITGEDQIVRAIVDLDTGLLDQRGLQTDTTRLLVGTNSSVGAGTISAYSKPSNAYTGLISAAALTKSNAGSNSSGIFCFHVEWGAADSGANTTKATVKSEYAAYVANVTSDIATGVFSQPRAPYWFGNALGGTQLNDGPDANGALGPVQMAFLEMFGISPATGFTTPSTPDMYCIGANYYLPDHATELTSNAYAIWGAKRAEVMTRVIGYGQNWKPTHVIGGTIRSNQCIVDIYAPDLPIKSLAAYVVATPTLYTDLGFTLIDSVGTLTITSAQVVSTTGVMLTCSRTIGSTTSNISSIVRSGNVTTVTTATTVSGLNTGGWVTIAGASDSTLNGVWVTTSVSGTTITFASVGANSTGSVGTARMSEILKYGDAAIHNGNGNIADSDTWTSPNGLTYQYLGDGNGQGLAENFATVPANGWLQNGVTPMMPNFCVPTVIPVVSG